MTDPIPTWNRIANFWDEHLKEGNIFQLQLIMPASDRLLGDVLGKTVLDACCGNGNYSRSLHARGAKVTAFDGSAAFVERAKTRSEGMAIEFHVIDATSDTQLAMLGKNQFDAVVCSMAIMDLPVIDPLLNAVRRLLKPGGAFVWSICHPAFNSPRSRCVAELVTENGRALQKYSTVTTHYVTPYEELSEGILNQPEPHPMFHRSISDLLNACFKAGFIVDGFEEPAFAHDSKAKSAFSWAKRPEIPPAMVVRMR